MTAPAPASFDAARRVADAVLYEGYLLYPYRSSAQKNRLRWQFGVLAPPRAGPGERSSTRTETLLEAGPGAGVHLRLRFLHLETRPGGAAGGDWDEGVEVEVDSVLDLDRLLEEEQVVRFAQPGEDRSGRRQEAVTGLVQVSAHRLAGPYRVIRLRVDVENTTAWAPGGAGREEVLRHSLVATHLLIGVSPGRLLSLTDPPEWARPAAEQCVNDGTWPVLIGGTDGSAVVLSSPIILADHTEVAEESPGDLFDATEIDEILSLRILALTDAEKEEARATDPRAAAIVDRLETLPPEVWDRLHGAVRSLRPVPGAGVAAAPADDLFDPAGPWWDPSADGSVSPETDSVVAGGVAVTRGCLVRLRPGRADAQDMFLAGRVAVVQAVLSDLDGGRHLAVTLEDDPAADLMQTHGRYLYFHPEEVEPL